MIGVSISVGLPIALAVLIDEPVSRAILLGVAAAVFTYTVAQR